MYSEWTYHIHQINNTVHCWLHIHVQLQGCTRLYTNPNYKAAQGCANCIFLAPGISPSNGGWGCLRKIQLLGKYQYKSHVKMKNHNPNQRAPMCFIQDLWLDVAAAYKKTNLYRRHLTLLPRHSISWDCTAGTCPSPTECGMLSQTNTTNTRCTLLQMAKTHWISLGHRFRKCLLNQKDWEKKRNDVFPTSLARQQFLGYSYMYIFP